MEWLRKIKFRSFTVPLVLLALALVSFGLLNSQLGFYWDDWSQTLISRLYGVSAYWNYFSADRPLSAWTHVLFMPMLGNRPMNWQFFTLLLRWLAVLGMWWSLRGLWPDAKRQVTMAALLFLVYPAFTQQPSSVSYHQHFTQYVLFFLSFGAMVYAVRQPRRFWLFTLLSLVAQLLHLSITEFFIGAEFLRPVILFFLLGDGQSGLGKRLWKTFKLWLPYLIVVMVYIIWRLFFIDLSGEDWHPPLLLYQLRDQPIAALANLGKFVLLDMIYICLACWSRVFEPGLLQASQPLVLVSWGLSLIVAAGIICYLMKLDESDFSDEKGKRKWMVQAVVLGVLVTLAGPAPDWVTGSQLVNPAIADIHSDRFALVAMFGISILFVVLIEWLGKGRWQKAVMLGLLIGLASGFHLRTANDFRWIWTRQERFYWQLTWRAPAIKVPTALVAEKIFITNQELFSTSSALNLLYPQAEKPENLAYWLYTLRPRFESGLPDTMQINYQTHLRSLKFAASTPDTLLLQFDPETASCLWMLDSVYSKDNPDLPELTAAALPISNLTRIEDKPAEPGYPPADIFGTEIDHGWCYLFQKADLARQNGDWERVVELGVEATNQGFVPGVSPSNSPYEWSPFIEGYAHVGQWDTAEDLTSDNYQADPKYRQFLCSLWQRIEQTATDSDGKVSVTQFLYGQLECTPDNP